MYSSLFAKFCENEFAWGEHALPWPAQRALAADEESPGLRTLRKVLNDRSHAQGIWASYVLSSDEREEVGLERPAVIGRHHNFTDTHIPKGGSHVKLRRLILLPSDEDKQTSESALERENGPDWDLLTEVDRLRTTSSGLSAEVQRQTQIGQDYARAASEQRLRVEELERENAIAHSNCQMLEGRLSQTEERAAELEELVEVLRAQRDRLQTYCEQQKDRADGLDAAFAAVRDAAGELLAAGDRQTHAALGTRGLARAKVEYADALAGLRRALDRNAGRDFLAPVVVNDVRRFFTSENLAVEEKKKLSQNIVQALSTGD